MFQTVKTKFGKLMMLLLVVLCTVSLAIGLVGCSGDAKTISSVAINADGNLVITWSDGEEQDLGTVKGQNGQDGAAGADGEDGATGAAGVGVAKVEIVDGVLYIYYTNDPDTAVEVGPVKGEKGDKGDKGDTGAAGQDGQDGAPGADGKDGIGIKEITTKDAEDGDGFYIVITKDDETETKLGPIKDGEDGANGADGVGITNVEIDAEGNLVLTMTNGTTLNAGNVKGEKGDTGVGIAKVDIKVVAEGDAFVSETLAVGTYYVEITYTDSTAEAEHIDRIPLPAELGGCDCEVCEHPAEYVVEYRLSSAHTYNPVTGEVTMGCTLKVCNNCGWAQLVYDESEEVHTFEWVVEKEASCEETGLRVHKCTVCGYIDEQEEIPAEGHEWTIESQTIVDGSNICEDGGFEVKRCEKCDKTEVVVVEPQKHIFADGGTISTQKAVVDGKNVVQVTLSGTCKTCHEYRSYVIANIEYPDMEAEETAVATLAAPAEAIELDLNNAYVESYVAYTLEVTKYQEKCTDDGEFDIYFYVGETAEEAVKIEEPAHFILEGETDHTIKYGEDGNSVYVKVGEAVDLNEYGIVAEGGLISPALNYPTATCAIADAVAEDTFVSPEDPTKELGLSQGDYLCAKCGERVRVITYRSHEYESEELVAVPGQAPTCEGAGYEAKTCIWGCGKTDPNEAYWDKYENGYGHQWTKGEGDVTIKVTNYVTGAAEITIPVICSVCNKVETFTEKTTGITVSTADLSVPDGATCKTACTYTYDITYEGARRGEAYKLEWLDQSVTVTAAEYVAACGHIRLTDVDYFDDEKTVIDLNGENTITFLAQEGNENFFTAKEGTMPEGKCFTDEFAMTYTCPTCEQTVEVNVVKAHKLPEEYTIKQPTCVDKGSYSYTCTICEEDVAETPLDELGHRYEYEFTLTEGEGGAQDTLTLKAVGCKVCGVLAEPVVIFDNVAFAPAAGTDTMTVKGMVQGKEVEFTITYTETEQSTCAVPGTGTYTVTFDNPYNVYVAPEAGSAPKVSALTEPLSLSDSKQLVTIPHKVQKYNDEGELVKVNFEGEIAGDDYVFIIFGEDDMHYVLDAYYDEQPTCQPETWEGAWGRFTCTDCGGTIIVKVGGSHEFSDWTVDTPATCTTKGEETRTCKYCGTVETREIPATGHGVNGYTVEVIVDPTLTATGEYSLICNDCEETVYTGTIDVLPAKAGSTVGTYGTYVAKQISGSVCMGIEYSYTYTVTYEGKTYTIKSDGWNTFVEATQDHKLGTDAYIWEAEDGLGVTWKYTGYLCEQCGNVIATRVVVARPEVTVTNDTELAAAVKAAQDGSVIKLAAGTYNTDIDIYAKNITLEGAADGATIINGYIRIGTNNSATAHDGSFLTIRNITLVNPERNTSAQMGISLAPNEVATNFTITIDNCKIDGFLFGVQLGGSNVTESDLIINDTIFANNWCAISIGQEGNEFSITGATSFDEVTYQLQDYRDGNNYYTVIGAEEPSRTNNEGMPSVEAWYDTVHADDEAAA